MHRSQKTTINRLGTVEKIGCDRAEIPTPSSLARARRSLSLFFPRGMRDCAWFCATLFLLASSSRACRRWLTLVHLGSGMAQVALNPFGEVALAIPDHAAKSRPARSSSGYTVTFKRARRKAEKLGCLLLVEKRIHFVFCY
jgi:hypothetical protein